MIATCPECHEPLLPSRTRPGAFCPSAWDECSRSGRDITIVRVGA